MTSVDELQRLIDQVCSYPDRSKERQKALNKLLIVIQQLRGIYKSSHPDYPEALNRTWEWLCREIGKFKVRSDKADLQQSSQYSYRITFAFLGLLKTRSFATLIESED